MDNFRICRPTQFYFGGHLENDVGNIIRNLGKKRVLVVYGQKHCLESGLLDRVQKSLVRAGLEFVCRGGVQPNPRVEHVYELIKAGRNGNVDFVLAVGGGSVIDAAKTAAIGIANNFDVFDCFLGQANPQRALEHGVIVTLAGSGSEGSASAVVQKVINNRVFKLSFSSGLNVPKFAILNPELALDAPQYLVGCGIVMTMANVMARFFTNSVEVSLTDRMCESILLSVVETTPRLVKNPHQYAARSNLMWAATMANNDWCTVGREPDWSAHILAFQLAALYDINFGAALAIVLPAWMEFTLDHNPMRYAQLAHRVFGVPVNFRNPFITAKQGITALRNFFKRLNLPLSFKDIGAQHDDISRIIRVLEILEKLNHHSIGQFVHLSLTDCEKIYNIAASYELTLDKASPCDMTMHDQVPFGHPYGPEYEDNYEENTEVGPEVISDVNHDESPEGKI